MIVRVPDLSAEVRTLDFSESATALNDVLAATPGWAEQRFHDDVQVHAEIYKQGSDVYFNGTLAGRVQCTCPRCLDDFLWPMRRDFTFLIVKAPADQDFEDDAGLDHYDADELDLGRLAREQALLALDNAVLCSEGCRGLCSRCGANLNHEPCTCASKHLPT